MQIASLGQEDPLEEEMATLSNILAWRIPRAKEPGGLQSAKSQTQLGTEQTDRLPLPTQAPVNPLLHQSWGKVTPTWNRKHPMGRK